MTCPICDNDYDSMECLHYGEDFIKIIKRALENISDLDGYAEETYLCSAKDMKEILEGKS